VSSSSLHHAGDLIAPHLRGHVHHRSAAPPYLFRLQALLVEIEIYRCHNTIAIGIHQCVAEWCPAGEPLQPPRRTADMLHSTMGQPEVLATPSTLPLPPGPVLKPPSEDSDASGEDELEQSFQSFKSEEMTSSSSAAEGMKNQDVTEYLREQARPPPQSHACDPAHHATRVRCHRTASCRSQSSQRSWRASCPT